MKNLKFKVKSLVGLALSLSKGFTMIELLIVITVLGILAVAVLAAINPIEQINRGKDTGSRSDAEQLISAVDRYYTGSGFYPWSTAPAASQPTAWGAVGDAWTDGTTAVLTKLSTVGTAEIKESFVNRIKASGYNTLYKSNVGGQGDSTYVCFMPQSSRFSTEAGNRCGASLPGDFPTANACPSGCAAAKTCYSCLP